MADAKEYIRHMEQGGTINISQEVVAVLAATTLLDVQGAHVPGCTKSATGAAAIDRKRVAKAVSMVYDTKKEDSVVVDCNIYVDYGCVITDVAKAVQTAVKENLEAITGLFVSKVNVNVLGICFNKKA